MNRFLSPIPSASFSRLVLVVAFLVSCLAVVQAQAPAAPAPSPTTTATPEESIKSIDTSTPGETGQTAPALPNSSEGLQTRIERARALIAAHRLDTAASELESVRATTQDSALRNITSIMLMNVYLEEANYGRAEALLEETYQARGAQKDESLGTYFALAGQAVLGARSHLLRYRSFGVSTNGANLPAEAANDLNRLRALLERMIVQSKEISNGRRAYDSLSLLEDVLGLRLSLAKDSEDQSRWESEYASAREALASSQTQIASLGGIPPLRPGKSPALNPGAPSPYSTKRPEANNHASSEPPRASDSVGAPQAAAAPPAVVDSNLSKAPATKAAEAEVDDAGSLLPFAVRKVVPRYPPMAKQNGTVGLVRVHVIVEGGKVIAVSRSEGPILLRSAAEEAAKQWSFQVVAIEGRPTRLSGYIDFNFSL